MKKGLLLSVVASTMMFAGGDIAPVEPAAPASADFWGQIGFAYQAQDMDRGTVNVGGITFKNANKEKMIGDYLKGTFTGLKKDYETKDYKFGDTENNAFSSTVVLGVEKELGYGIGFGAEIAGWSDFGLDIADQSRVSEQLWRGVDQTAAEVSQAYLTYTFGNTAIKAGRQALPAAVSPWAWSDRSAGVIDISYDAIVIANTDIQDTTIVGAWVANAANVDSTVHLGDNNAGIFMLAAINKSLANTTLSMSGYYFPDSNLVTYGQKPQDMWSIWANAITNFDGWNAGLQFAYVDGDYKNVDATYAVAAKVGSTFGDFNVEAIAGYINDGDYFMRTAGTPYGTSAFWTDDEMDGDISPFGQDQYAILAKAGYKLSFGELYGSLGYWSYGNTESVNGAGIPGYDDAVGARVGYKFTVAGVNAKVEYRYRNVSYQDGVIAGQPVSSGDDTRQRIRVEAYYKF
jgi:hypothetical protein